jgi:sugar/nucleoside kinase (ribokinase family)
MTYDIAFIGHYTRDTIVYPHATRTADGGGYFFGANVAAQMGLKVAVVTRLAREDWGAVAKLERLGVAMLARLTPTSTALRLAYPTANLDQRTIELSSWAGPFDLADLADVSARAYAIAASSVRGEISLEVIEALAARGGHIALDVQGFMRVLRDGVLGHDAWLGKEAVLRHVTILKTDAFEAELLTGEADRAAAARRLAAYGPREVLVTNAAGVLLCHDGEITEAPFVPCELRGRSGRGDTCAGAYLAKRLSASPREALFWTAAVTSLKLETEGPFRRNIAEVEALYRRLLDTRAAGA